MSPMQDLSLSLSLSLSVCLSVLTAIFPVELGSSSQIITTNKPTPNVLQVGRPNCRPTNSIKAMKGKYHIPRTSPPQARLGVFQLCL